jgi:hypothetical protein
MPFAIDEFNNTIDSFYQYLRQIPAGITPIRPAEDEWSLKEIVGHLADSATNNIQRFVRLQEESMLLFPMYDRDSWIRIQKYNDYDWNSLVEFWRSLNAHLMHVIKNIDPNMLSNSWRVDGSDVSLDWLVNDYFRHLTWHIDHFKQRHIKVKG